MEDLIYLHDQCFLAHEAPKPEWELGTWWLMQPEPGIGSPDTPTGFVGYRPSWYMGCAYLWRVGVRESLRGYGHASAMVRRAVIRAKKEGYDAMISDTTCPKMGNVFIRTGFRLYAPERPWALPNSMYWRKLLS